MVTLRFIVLALLVCGIAGISHAQVLVPAAIKDPKLRALQSKHLSGLTEAAAEITAHSYPAKFYLTRELDLSASALKSADDRSIEFATFEKQTVLLIRGNYSVAYPVETPSKDRVSRTYLDVALPILKAVMQRVKDETEMDAVEIELSHHVRRMAVVTIDRFENSAFVLPRELALKVAEATDPNRQLAALTGAKVYIDGHVVAFGEQTKIPAAMSATVAIITPASPVNREVPSATVADRRKVDFQPAVDRMLQELGAQANFDPSAKPALITFRGASYLRISVLTNLAAADAGSQYRLAALAFDRHISHLVRSVLPYFKDAGGFEGIAFRTTVNAGSSTAPDSVEFLFPMAELKRYENYDITGQQLINAGFVLINGERVGLDLQTAEAVKP